MGSNFLRSLFSGGASILIWGILVVGPQSLQSEWALAHDLIFIFGAFLALIFYQPHFISTYALNYGRGWNYIRQFPFHFLIFPAVLVLFILTVGLNTFFQSGLQWINLPWILLFTMMYAVVHFAFQAVAVIALESPVTFTTLRIQVLRSALVILGWIGLFRHMGFHGGSTALFGIETPRFNLDPKIFDSLTYLIVLLNVFLFVYLCKKGLKLRASIPWIAFCLWYSSNIILKDFFYLVPVFHSLQYFPFFYDRIKSTLRNPWFYASAIVVISLFVVQLIPMNLGKWFNFDSKNSNLLFVSILISFNLHHFVMESVTWKKNLIKR